MKKQLYRQLSNLALIFLLFGSLNGFLKGQAWETECSQTVGGVDIIELPNTDLVYIDSMGVHCTDKYGISKWSTLTNPPLSNNATPIELALSNGNLIIVLAWNNWTYRNEMIFMSFSGVVYSRDTLPASFNFVRSLHALSGSDFALSRRTLSGDNTVSRLDTSLNFQWTVTFQTPTGYNLTRGATFLANNGDIILCRSYGSTTLPSKFEVDRINPNGGIIWSKSYTFASSNLGTLHAKGGVESQQGEFFLEVPIINSSLTTSDDTLRLLILDSNGDSLSMIVRPGFLNSDEYDGIFRTADGLLARLESGYSGSNYIQKMHKLDWNGNKIWTRGFSVPGKDVWQFQAIALSDSGFATTGRNLILNIGWWELATTFNFRMDQDGFSFENMLIGSAYYDLNSNCTRDPGEPAVPNTAVAISGDTSLYFSTDSAGSFHRNLNAGTYSLQLAPGSPYWQLASCSGPLTASFLGVHDTVWVDIPLEPTIFCPDLRVDIAAQAFVVCQPATFTVTYQNTGTIAAVNSYVDVEIPPSITVDSASIPWVTPQSGSTFRFLLDSIGPLQSGNLLIHTTVDCPTNPLDLISRTECATAHIYPDTSCLPVDSLWDGASVAVEMQCLSNNLRLVIRNTGSSAMSSPGGFIVLEDNILRTDSTFLLPDNDSLVLFRPANGSTWALFAEQRPGHPGSSHPMVAIEGCSTNTSNGISTGILPQLPQDDMDDFISIHCRTYLASYDPNDKIAFSQGIGPAHYVSTDREIEYMVRFQNTGTFYAFHATILDTLDPNLDPMSLRVLAASHPFTWQLLPGSILRFDFPMIMLPNSSSDEPGSHGYVKYEITPFPNLAPGLRLENSASIYFDSNLPIRTNTAYHTIAELRLGAVKITDRDDKKFGITAFPNPFAESTTFRLSKQLYGTAIFTVRNLEGQVVHRQQLRNPVEFNFSAGTLPSGIYFFNLSGDGIGATGKIVLFR